MRSVRVVLPESMWALMPILRILAMSLLMDRSLSTFHACRDVRGLTGAEASGCAEIEQSDRYYSRNSPPPQVRSGGRPVGERLPVASPVPVEEPLGGRVSAISEGLFCSLRRWTGRS